MRNLVGALIIFGGCAMVTPVVRQAKGGGITVEYKDARKRGCGDSGLWWWCNDFGMRDGTEISVEVGNDTRAPIRVVCDDSKMVLKLERIRGVSATKHSVFEVAPGYTQEVAIVFEQVLDKGEEAEIALAVTTSDGAALRVPPLVIRGK